MRTDDHDSIRAGLYIGPVLLAIFFAQGFYRTICEGGPFAFAGRSLPMGPILAAFTLYLAAKVPTKLERTAWLAAAAHFTLTSLRWMVDHSLGNVAGWLLGIWAVLLTAAGVRRPTPKKITIVAVIFVLVFVASLFAQQYGRGLAGRSTVFAAAPICA